MKTYEQTHSWINFELNLRDVDYRLWIMLGQAKEKCEHIAGIPLMPDLAAVLHRIYLAKGALATTAIEGNTLTEEEVNQLIEQTLQLPPSKEYLATEVRNIIDATNDIAQKTIIDDEVDLTVEKLQEYNRIVLDKLPLAEHITPGELRPYSVTVGSYRGAPSEDVGYLLNRMCKWLNHDFEVIEDPMIRGILKAILGHLYFAWIHPFGDGNGRAARLLEFQILLSAGVPTDAAHLLSNHYNQTRTEYYRLLSESSRRNDQQGVFNFIFYALQGFIDGLQEQIDKIEGYQLRALWRNHIFDSFSKIKDTKTNTRRRRLILDLTDQEKPVHIPELRYITGRITEAYYGLTDKTIQRDVNELVKLGLVLMTIDGIIPNFDSMRAFLPQRRLQEA